MSETNRRTGAAPLNVWVEGSPGFRTIETILTVSTSPAYTSGDSIGGVFVFNDVVAEAGQAFFLRSLRSYDMSNQKAAGTLLLFKDDPTLYGATVTDNAAFVWGTAMNVLIGAIGSTTYTTLGSQAVFHLAATDRIMATRFTRIYGAYITTNTPTYTTIGDLRFELGIERA